MKKKLNLIVVILIAVFDILFYKQAPGINVFYFTVLLLTFCLYTKPHLRNQKPWLLTAVASLMSSVFIGIYGDILSVLSCLLSYSLLASYTAEKGSGLITAVPGIALSYLRSPWYIIKILRIQIIKLQSEKKNQRLLKTGIFAMVFIIGLAFFFIYRNSSILFYNLTSKIELEFISISLILFTLNAFLLYVAFQRYTPQKTLYKLLDLPAKHLKKPDILAENRINMEQYAGILLLGILNALLLTVNILDLEYLVSQKLPHGVSFSRFIHQGVEMLIFSIILAISIILYFFRNELNFSKNNWLKIFAYTWIVQNIFMVFSNVSRNAMYIDAYGLTERRIGVYFYLFLAGVGLVITLIKIYQKYSNAFYIRTTAISFLVILILSCPVPWTNIITKHNLSRNDVDNNFEYLTQISESNLPILLKYTQSIHFKQMKQPQEKLELLHHKLLSFIKNYKENQSWQSFNYISWNTYNKIKQNGFNSIYIDGSDYILPAIKYLKNINELILSNAEIRSYNKWQDLENLKKLHLDSCKISDSGMMFLLNNLEYLELSNCQINSFTPLYSLKNLKELRISNINTTDLQRLRLMLPNTKILIKKIEN